MIKVKDLIEKFKQALSEKWGYIWGTAGEMWTEAKQKALEKTTDSDRAQGRAYGSKWIGRMVTDCSGLFSWAFRKLGGYMYHGSDTMYKKYCTNKGELVNGKRTDKAVLKVGTAVFVWNGEKYSHVGLYVGDGVVIEAMTTLKGVVSSKVTNSKWTHWGELKGVDYSTAPDDVPEKQEEKPKDKIDSGSLPTLRKGDKGSYVVLAQTILRDKGYSLGKWGIDGSFGDATEKAVKQFQRDFGLVSDGIIGKKTWAKLNSAELPIQKYTVTVPHLSSEQSEKLMAEYPGSSREVEKG